MSARMVLDSISLQHVSTFLQDLNAATGEHEVRIGFEFYVQIDELSLRARWCETREEYVLDDWAGG